MHPQSRCVPEIATRRLRLREHNADDLDACAAMWSDPAVVRYIGGKPFTRSECWGRLLRYAGMWQMLGYGFWAVETMENGEFVGEIGVMDAKRDIDPPIVDPEVGWAFMPKVHGQGYATEALAAVLDWADRMVDAPATMCMIEDQNGASIRVATKFGYRSYTTTSLGDSCVTLFRRPRKIA
jgi:RimJ/RimL family protein N-acetyltransferase